ncbi:AAA family ATPase [Dietzia maris]|uniref:AAA family ATPase n=1 Tax=Dietzia maris TaxID=37915 RepID=UPI00344B8B94
MRITHLHGTNFRSLDDVAIDLTDDGMIALIGAPGSGKSSLLSLVPFVLYGDTGQNGALTDLRRRGSDESERCGGSIALTHNGDRIEASRWLTRTRPKGKIKETGHASLAINGETIDGITPTRLTSEITRILGQPKDAFRGANFIGQGEVDVLATATPTEVQALVEHHTGLASLTRARQRAREASRDAATKAKALPGDEAELERAEINLAEAEEETAEARDAARTAGAQRERARENLDAATAEADRLRAASDAARSSKDRLVGARAIAESARDQLAQTTREAELAIGGIDLDTVADQLADVDSKLQELTDAGVSYKHSRTAAARAESYAAETHRTAQGVDRESVNREVEDAKAKIAAADSDGRSAAERGAAAEAEMKRLERALGQLDHAESGKACCPTCRQQVADLDGLRAQFQQEVADCRDRLAKAHADRRTAGAAHEQASSALERATATLRDADTAARDAARADQDRHAAAATADERAQVLRAAITALDGQVDVDCDGQELLDAGLAAHAGAKQVVAGMQAAQQAGQAIRRAHAAVADADQAVAAAQEGLRDEPDPEALRVAVETVQRLRADHDEKVAAASRADQLLSASEVGVGQMQVWVESERAKWDAKSKALADAEVAAGTADAITALRSELLAEYTGQISASATELLARFGGEHVAFHLDSDFVPRVELLDGTLVDTRTLSGGEKARAGLAFRLGITLQITQGGVPDQVLGDEVTNYLDEDGRRAVIAALQQLFPSVVLISHTSEALDFASRTISLERDPLGATTVDGQPRPEPESTMAEAV